MLGCVASLSLSMSACCEKPNVNDQESEATPSIKYIRPTDPALADQLLTGAAMGDVIAIIGEGLEGVVSILFNDVEAELNPALITSNSIICSVPAVMPTEITNTITLTTGLGNVLVYDFAVAIPKPFISGVDCEWAAPGKTMTLTGQYFYPFVDSNSFNVTFPGGVAAEVVDFSETSMTVTVPDCQMEGAISIEGEYGVGLTKFNYRDSRGMFIDFEDLWWDGWSYSGSWVRTDDNSLSGNYVEFSTPASDWNWNTNGGALFFNNIQPDGSRKVNLIPEGDNPADYSLKFEVKINNWQDLHFSMWFSGVYNEFTTDGAEAQYHWAPFTEGITSTEDWITVSVPLNAFKTNKEETATDRVVLPGDMGNFCMFFFGGVKDAANAGTPISLYIDNLRLTKN